MRAKLGLILGAALIGLAAAGCETAEGYRQQTAMFLGASSDSLLVELGSPVARDTLSDGSEVWTYFRRERFYDPGGPRTIQRERRISFTDEEGNRRTRVETYDDTVYEPPREWWSDCETRFVIADGFVRDFRFEGDGCRAPELN